MTDLTVSIVSHGHGALVRALLADMAALPPPRPRVILTFNIPDEDFLVEIAGLDITKVVNDAPKGFGANHNAAFALNKSHWFCVLNPDIRFPTPPFTSLIAYAEPSVALIAPRVVAPDGRDEDAVRSNLTPWSLLRRHVGAKQNIDTDGFRWLAGMFMLVRSDNFAAVGGFDDRLFLYCEDYDLCARLVLAGYDLMLARDISVIHDARRDSRRSLRHLYLHLVSLARVWTSRVFLTITWRIWRDPRAFRLRIQDAEAARADRA